MSWRTARLGDVAAIERDGVDPSLLNSDDAYVGLENIDSESGEINPQSVGNRELKSTKFRFSNAHVLYGKLRPYLRKISCPNVSGVCSTDIIPLRPLGDLDRRYLYYVLRQDSMIALASKLAVGVNLPRLSPKLLAEFQIPLPPLDIQKKIAAVLDKSDSIRRKRKHVIAKLDELLQSVFLDMFGDPVTNPKGWKMEKLSAVSRAGIDGTHLTPPFTSSGVPFLFVSNIVENQIDYRTKHFIDEANFEKLNSRHQVEKGDVLYTIVGSYGNAAVVRESNRFAFQRHIAQIKPDPNVLLSEFLHHALISPFVRHQVDGLVRGLAQKTLNLAQLRCLLVPVPPIEAQAKFDVISTHLSSLRSSVAIQNAKDEYLFNSLLQRAFKGELEFNDKALQIA